MKATFKITAKNKYAAVANATLDDMKTGLTMVAEEIMTDSKQNYVPVITGTLRASGFVQEPVVFNKTVTVTLGFGGAASAYAAAVHEAPNNWGQGKNKYLSKPMNAAVPTLAARLARHIAAKQSAMKNGRVV